MGVLVHDEFRLPPALQRCSEADRAGRIGPLHPVYSPYLSPIDTIRRSPCLVLGSLSSPIIP